MLLHVQEVRKVGGYEALQHEPGICYIAATMPIYVLFFETKRRIKDFSDLSIPF